MTTALSLALWLALSLALGTSLAAQGSLPEVIDHLGVYLAKYEEVLATLVAEERYEQTLTLPPSGGRAGPSATEHRVLMSDFAMARLPGGLAWLGLRDTYSVDGRRIRTGESRLDQLLGDTRADAQTQAFAISRENVRYNLAADLVERNVNVPTMALDLLRTTNREQFSFAKQGEETIDGRRTWRVEYRERGRPTLIRNGRGRDQPARGLVWIVPGSGEVVKTTLLLADSRTELQSNFVVSYGADASLGMLVPVEMIEQYMLPGARIDSKAIYTNYRRFQTAARLVPQP